MIKKFVNALPFTKKKKDSSPKSSDSEEGIVGYDSNELVPFRSETSSMSSSSSSSSTVTTPSAPSLDDVLAHPFSTNEQELNVFGLNRAIPIEPIPLNNLPAYKRKEFTIELNIEVEVLASQDEPRIFRLIAPLINLHRDFVGDYSLKRIWIFLALLSTAGIKKGDSRRRGCIYKSHLIRGMRLIVESREEIYINDINKWSQHFHYVTDGLITDWTFKAEFLHTLVPYEASVFDSKFMINMRQFGINNRKGPKGEFILVL